jgi:hypothetical protein
VLSYMTELDFVTESPFECAYNESGDAAFVKATCTISGWDIVEEYMACKLFSLLASFGLCEVTNGEMPVLKLAVPMKDFCVAKLPEEMNDDFHARVELTTANVVGRCARGEHKVCVEVMPNQGRVN